MVEGEVTLMGNRVIGPRNETDSKWKTDFVGRYGVSEVYTRLGSDDEPRPLVRLDTSLE